MNFALVTLMLAMAVTPGVDATHPFSRPGAADDIPADIIGAARAHLVDLVGERFFDEHCTFSPDESGYRAGTPDCAHCPDFERHPYYVLRWRLRVSGKRFVDEMVSVVVDESGAAVSEPIGLPDCVHSPALCEFRIDDLRAIAIASASEFEPGIRPWKINFHWHDGELRRYVWVVSNTLSESEDDCGRGKNLVIDAATGAILQVTGWYCVY